MPELVSLALDVATGVVEADEEFREVLDPERGPAAPPPLILESMLGGALVTLEDITVVGIPDKSELACCRGVDEGGFGG